MIVEGATVSIDPALCPFAVVRRKNSHGSNQTGKQTHHIWTSQLNWAFEDQSSGTDVLLGDRSTFFFVFQG